MKNRFIFIISAIGIAIGLFSAYWSGRIPHLPSPVFNPAPNPYTQGIYANGIVESDQPNGENNNIFPEVAGVVSKILVSEGQAVIQGQALLTLNDSVQRATTEQLQAQADAAQMMLEELKNQPRKEVLAVTQAQMLAAEANLNTAKSQLQKQQKSFDLEPQSVSRDTLDNAINSTKVADANYQTAKKQYELTKAGAWVYDIKNQEQQYNALYKAYLSANALLEKFTIRATGDGVVLAIKTAIGSYISPQGSYDPYTEQMTPAIITGNKPDKLAVRCYIDEILVPRLPATDHIQATMFIRGTKTSVPLEFVRLQPYVSPKIQLSNQRTERVDVRVLPILFHFDKTPELKVYPGQLVDIYVGEK